MKSRKIRWMVVSFAAAALFITGAVRFYLRANFVSMGIYLLAAVIFCLISFAYYKGYLR
jgi:hypothetical protein